MTKEEARELDDIELLEAYDEHPHDAVINDEMVRRRFVKR